MSVAQLNLCYFAVYHDGFYSNFITVYVRQYLNCVNRCGQCYSSASWRMSTKDALNVKIIIKVKMLMAII